MKIFFTGNLQFGRPSAIKYFKRPFHDVEHMDQTLRANWNQVVGEDDIVYVLGNFAWDPTTAEEMLTSLNGTIIIVPGEIDAPLLELEDKEMMPEGCAVIEHIFTADEDNLTISYWPLMEWPKKSTGAYSFFGFPNAKYKTDHKKRMVNVACDFWGYKPQSLENIMALFKDIEELK